MPYHERMSSYFYHLTLELFPTPLLESLSNTLSTTEADNLKPITRRKEQDRDLQRDIYLPQSGADIFQTGDWPKHKSVKADPSWKRVRRDGTYSSGSDSDAQATTVGGKKSVVIDCSTSSIADGENDQTRVAYKSIPIARTKALEFPPPSAANIQRELKTASRDWRFGRVRIESLDMVEMENREGRRRGESSMAEGLDLNATLSLGDGGRVTKARFRALEKGTEVGWGVVHLYRDGEETSGLGTLTDTSAPDTDAREKEADDDCTVLCIPAVPSYLTPSDLLGFVGEKTRDEVSHFRMVMTGRMNRYLVLMKFRDEKVARNWRKEWDGKVFNSMEPETCQVVFVKSITIQTPSASRPNTSFPELSHDPFTPSPLTSTFLKPFPPPTPNLVELPTCPVCLERMDDTTTGLLTILCQHVFHCDCLQKWSGSGCPVCRHTNPSMAQHNSSSYPHDPTNPPFGSGEASLCTVCDCTDDLWICLICGNVGCGRYKGGHAKDHWKESAHNFALEIDTQHVWDYAGDIWVHRLIRAKGDSKVIELPAPSRAEHENAHGREDMDMVPREKLENIGMEYTHLLTSQLDSQRVYFEELVNKAVAKASAASLAASTATSRADSALLQLQTLTLSHNNLLTETIPTLERDLAREKRKAEKSAEIARGFGKSLMEEKKVSEGLLERIGHVNKSMVTMSEEMSKLKEENEELREANRDLLFSVSAGEKIREMGEVGEEEGGLGKSEIEEGSLIVPPEKKKRGGSGGKGKGKA